MNNAEFYKKEIEEICEGDNGLGVVNGRPQPCRITTCSECEFVDKAATCCTPRIKWLISEHEERRVDWTKVAVDTPILVSENDTKGWHRGYFSKYQNGHVYAYTNGATSWSSMGDDSWWHYAKLASENN